MIMIIIMIIDYDNVTIMIMMMTLNTITTFTRDVSRNYTESTVEILGISWP